MESEHTAGQASTSGSGKGSPGSEPSKRGEEQLYRHFLEKVNEGVVALSAEGQILYCNPKFAEILGFSTPQVLNVPFDTFVTEKDRSLFKEFLAESTRESRHLKLLLSGRPGMSVMVQLSASPFVFENNSGVSLVVTDLTDLRAHEEALKEALDRFQAASDNIRDALIVVESKQGCITGWNPAAEKIFGYTREEMIGQNLHEVLADPGYRQIAHNSMERFRETGEGEALGKTLELTAVRKGGEKFPIELSLSAMRLKGEWYGVGVVHDITERKAAEKALRQSEAQLYAAFESIMDAVIITTLDGQLLLSNQAAMEIHGFKSSEEFRQALPNLKYLYELSTMDGAPLPYEEWPMTRILRGEIINNYRFRERRIGSNVQRIFSCRGMLANDWDDKPLMAVISLRDITEELQIDRFLRQSQRMEAVGQLTGGIAHDFNNIIQVILNYSQFAEEGSPEGSQVREDLAQVILAAKRATDLTRQLLAFSQRTVITIAPMDVRPVIKELVSMLEHTIPASISISSCIAQDLPQITADGTQVQQVLLNLAINARDALPQGGRISINAFRTCVSEELAREIFGAVPGDFVAMEVADTGKGIPEEILHRIYEPFFTTKGPGKGIGLGLAYAYGIMKQHRGFILCETILGEGTTFRVYFPVDHGDSASDKAPATVAPSPRGNECILVADDQEPIVSMVHRNLEGLGYSVFSARNGKEALEIYQREMDRIALVVLDHQMPEMDGAVCFEKIRVLSPQAKVILTTGFLDRDLNEQLQRLGITMVLPKPYAFGELAIAIRAALDA